ncbi:MAG: alpha-2-macroglobulin family protein, partial [Paludibacter sp.]|nr:alpha-2-macroglobulin family protein [Paludibacter sp.]
AFAARFQYYRYEITADVTAANGETQQGSTSLMIGEQSLILFSTVPALIEKSRKLLPEIKIENLNGKTVDKTVFYELNYIIDDGNLNEGMEWPGSTNLPTLSKLVHKGNFLSSDSLKLDVSKLNSGKYRLQLYTLDEVGDTIKAENRFILYGFTDKKPAVSSYTWLTETTLTATPGQAISIPFGTSLRRAWVLYEVNYGNKLIEQKWMRQCNSIRKYRVLFDENYKDGLTVRFTIVHAGKVHVKEVLIKAPAMKKELKPQLTVFRDKLRPGSEEHWTVAIANANKQNAELLAGMYDAALDQFVPLQWQFSPVYTPPVPRTSNWALQNWYWSNGRWHYQYPFAEETAYSIANIDFYDVPSTLVADRNPMQIRIRGMKASSTRVPGNIEVEDDNVVFAMVESPGMPEEVTRTTLQLRENFNETAFFYPQLQADTSGLFLFSFTLPESLTRWKLKLLAHSRDLFNGQSEYTFESQKELMVNMNLPRFIRQSDSWELQVSVVNLTNQAADTRVKLHIFNPLTDEPVAGFSPEIKTIRLEANGQQTLSWKIPALPAYDLVACRIEAQTAEFSDGEQRYLPILSDRMLVTESIPFAVKGETTVELTALPEGTEVKQLSLEFTANPSWTALQALPLLSVPESGTAIDLLGAWYSNTVSLQVVKSNPILKKVIQQLSARGLTEEAWISQLEKNEDLKMLVLKETPWVQAAADQTQQQRELIRLLNEQQLQNDARKYLKELSTLQNSSGGFSWMAGMPESRYITQLVAEKLQRMASESVFQNDIVGILNRALVYLDACMVSDYEQLKKADKKFTERKTITTLQLHYLTLRSAFPELEVSKSVFEAYLYYSNQICTYRHSFSIYEKALAAQFFHRTGQSTYTHQMLQSLRELAVNDPLKGMYWPRLKSGWLWNERPLSIHTRILEAFTEIQSKSNKQAEINIAATSQRKLSQNNRIATNTSDTEAMKLWLLNQKQTTHWDNRLTTLEAVMAILTTGESLLSQSPEYRFIVRTTDFQQPLLELKTENAIPGSGYFHQSLPLNTCALITESIPSAGSTTYQPDSTNDQDSDKTGSVNSRGAVYRQYFQDRDKSQQTGKELKVERRYYLQKIEEGVSTLTELEAGIQVQPGDKLISRIVLNVENDYDFVVLRDTKAASLEAVSPLSGNVFKDGLLYYRNPGDVSTSYFFHHLPRGNYVLEESYYLTHTGDFSAGLAEIQCLYAPEYGGKSAGTRINSAIDKK